MTHQARADETRGRILQASIECFTEAGYDATGVAEICARAGVSKGAFYHHFPTKQALFLVLFETWISALDEPLRAALEGEGSVPDRLRCLAVLVERVFVSASGQIPLFLEFWRQAARQPEVWTVIVEPYRRFQDSFARLIEQGVAEGSLRSVNAEETGRVLVSLGVGLVLQGLMDPQGADWGRVTGSAVETFLTGLAK
jgi:AcrR family transcriptional regulator